MLLCSTNSKEDEYADQELVQPSYRHMTSSVSAVKLENATVNSKAIVNMYGSYHSSFYGCGTNENAGDAQKEIRTTFDNIMRAVQDSDLSTEQINELLFENGVLRRVIAFGDPFHVANLCVTWASIFAFGDTEKADHSQVHHRQLLQSLHSLHSADPSYSQAIMDEVMAGSGTGVRVSTKRERVQRWMVNQWNAQKTLDMFSRNTSEGVPSLIAWALQFANKSRSNWKRRVGREIATWLSMELMILGLQFEAEIGSYFEEIYAWHNRPGPINKRPGF